MSTILDFLSNILFNVLFSDIGTVLLMPIVICQCIAEKITTAVTIQETELTMYFSCTLQRSYPKLARLMVRLCAIHLLRSV